MGRRWGKTTLGVLLASKALEGVPVGWFAPTYKYLDEPWKECLRRFAPAITRSSRQSMAIEMRGGGVLDFWTLENQDAGRGRKYGLVIIDEAGLDPNLEETWTHAIRPTLTDLKGKAWFLGTPKPKRYFVNLYRKGVAGSPGWRSWNLPTTDNPWISRKEIAEAMAGMPEAAAKQEYLGIEADDGGNPFGMDAIRRCVSTLSGKAPVCYGVDLAKSEDWTVLIGLDEAGATCRFERWQGPWSETTKRLESIIGDTPALIDSTGVGDPIVEGLQRTLPAVEGLKFSATSKQQLMEGLAVAIQRTEIFYPDGLIPNELESYGYEYTKTGVRYSAPSGLHDDCVCALALARSRWNRLVELPEVAVFGDTRTKWEETPADRMARMFGDD